MAADWAAAPAAVPPPLDADLALVGEGDRTLLQRIHEEPWTFVPHDIFRKGSCERLLFGKSAREMLPNHAMDCTNGDGGIETTLTTAQEILLFQQYNYARKRVADVMTRYRGKRLAASTVHKVLGWAHRAIAARAHIIQANMPLVLAMAKRTRLNALDYSDLISEGNLALLRSVDKFDCSRGFKFSTYACRAILKSFSRVAMRTSRYRCRFPTEFDPEMEKGDAIEQRHTDMENACVDEIRTILSSNRADLSEVERAVIRERFALDAPTTETRGKTLEEVGEMIGVTKERVRQIQNKALAKLRSILEDEYLAA